MREKHLFAIAVATASNSNLNCLRFRRKLATFFLSAAADPVCLASTNR